MLQVIEGFPRLIERATQKLAEARANLQPAPLFVRPSTQWYCSGDQSEATHGEKTGLWEAVRDEFGVWHVCYSMHSSRDELEWALQLLQPKWVVSTTPPCRAMELDYVKKHCYKTCIAADDPLWKLFKVGNATSASLSASVVSDANNVMVTSIVKASEVTVEAPLQLEVSANNMELNLDLQAPSGTRTVTLFGRARLGIPDKNLLQAKRSGPSDVVKEQESVFLQEELIIDHASTVEKRLIIESSPNKVEDIDAKRNVNTVSFENHEDECNIEKLVEEGHADIDAPNAGSTSTFCSVKTNNEEVDTERDVFCHGSSRGLNISLRKLYRSMNVPVPRPLPSLVELMSSSKRFKLGSKYVSSRVNYCFNSSHYISRQD